MTSDTAPMTSTVALRIKSLRTANALTQEDLASRSGLGLATIQRAERGDRLSPDTLASLAAAFDIDAVQLTDEGGRPDEHPYLPLSVITTGRQLLDIIGRSSRLDFDFAELASLDQAEQIEALQAFCEPLGAERIPTAAVARMKLELEAKDVLVAISTKDLVVTGGTFSLTCYEIDEEGFGGVMIMDGQWEETCGVLRVSPRRSPIERGYVMDQLGKWETPGSEVVFPSSVNGASQL